MEAVLKESYCKNTSVKETLARIDCLRREKGKGGLETQAKKRLIFKGLLSSGNAPTVSGRERNRTEGRGTHSCIISVTLFFRGHPLSPS